MQDKELLSLIARGDKAAMKALYQRHEASLYHFIRSRLGDAFEASDVMQEAFLEVWRSAARYRGQSSVKTWLFGIARNKSVDRIRKANRMTLRDTPDETIPDDSPSPLDVIEAASDTQRVQECLKKLPQVQLNAVRLAFFDDLTYPEAAEVEGVPVGTIKTRIFHAKKALMHCLARGMAERA